MPKVYLTKQQKMNDKLVSLIYGTMKVKRITQQTMAEHLVITQQAFSRKLKVCQFSFAELIIIFDVLGFTDEEILSVVR